MVLFKKGKMWTFFVTHGTSSAPCIKSYWFRSLPPDMRSVNLPVHKNICKLYGASQFSVKRELWCCTLFTNVFTHCKVHRPRVKWQMAVKPVRFDTWNIVIFLQCWLSNMKDIHPVESWVLICCWWWFAGALHILELQLSSQPPSSLAAIKSRIETFWYRLTWVFLANGRETSITVLWQLAELSITVVCHRTSMGWANKPMPRICGVERLQNHTYSMEQNWQFGTV